MDVEFTILNVTEPEILAMVGLSIIAQLGEICGFHLIHHIK